MMKMKMTRTQITSIPNPDLIPAESLLSYPSCAKMTRLVPRPTSLSLVPPQMSARTSSKQEREPHVVVSYRRNSQWVHGGSLL